MLDAIHAMFVATGGLVFLGFFLLGVAGFLRIVYNVFFRPGLRMKFTEDADVFDAD